MSAGALAKKWERQIADELDPTLSAAGAPLVAALDLRMRRLLANTQPDNSHRQLLDRSAMLLHEKGGDGWVLPDSIPPPVFDASPDQVNCVVVRSPTPAPAAMASPPSGGGVASGGSDGLDKLKIEELKTMCRDRKLPLGGNKPDLVKRIKEANAALPAMPTVQATVIDGTVPDPNMPTVYVNPPVVNPPQMPAVSPQASVMATPVADKHDAAAANPVPPTSRRPTGSSFARRHSSHSSSAAHCLQSMWRVMRPTAQRQRRD